MFLIGERRGEVPFSKNEEEKGGVSPSDDNLVINTAGDSDEERRGVDDNLK